MDTKGTEKVSLDELLPLEREIPATSPQQPHPERAVSRGIATLFAQEREDQAMDTSREFQKISSELRHTNKFVLYPSPRLHWKEFMDVLEYARQKNIVIVHFSCHSDPNYICFLQNAFGHSTEDVAPRDVADMLCIYSTARQGTVECVVLNGCSTEPLARKLRAGGMPHVVCWRDIVHDDAAMILSEEFYTALHRDVDAGVGSIDSRHYKTAFDVARISLRRWKTNGGARTAWDSIPDPPADRDVLLFLSEAGDDLENTMPPPSNSGDRVGSTDAGESTRTVDPEPEAGDSRQPLGSADTSSEGVDAAGVVESSSEVDDKEDEAEVDEVNPVNTRNITNIKGQKECAAFKARRRTDTLFC
eukprot:478675-Rhodomonas_salina.1